MEFPVLQCVPVASCPVLDSATRSVIFAPTVFGLIIYTQWYGHLWAFFSAGWTAPALSVFPDMRDDPMP